MMVTHALLRGPRGTELVRMVHGESLTRWHVPEGRCAVRGEPRGPAMAWSQFESTLRSAVRAVRALPDRLLHGLRRRRAGIRLRKHPFPSRILVVCHGNICRSPYAEKALVERIPAVVSDAVTVCSAGFELSGRPSPPAALAAASSRGVDLSAHRSRQLDVDEVERSDLVIVMDSRQRRALMSWFGKDGGSVLVLGDLDPLPVVSRAVADPYGKGVEVFHQVFQRIDRCVGGLVGALEGRAGAGSSREVTPRRNPGPAWRVRPRAPGGAGGGPSS